MSEENNFVSYQKELNESLIDPPCIPFLGNFLTQVAHTHAYMTVQHKYKANSYLDKHQKDDLVKELGCKDNSLTDEYNCKKSSSEGGESSTCLINGQSIITSSHMRSDSDDSGVVLNLNRLSRTSDECEPSPRESCLSSPDEEGKKFEDVFQRRCEENCTDTCCEPFEEVPTNTRNGPGRAYLKFQSHEHDISFNRPREDYPKKKSVSLDHGEARRRQFIDIANIINNKPIEPDVSNELYECELQFWKYQISAVQYNIIPRTYIRRFLMNSPFNTEEDSYKLSLKREPPAPS